ncbi:hypothetical protein [Mucilaginibacter pedocola]|nr:hypothetical protein [Mucilaginibacter pedocola]
MAAKKQKEVKPKEQPNPNHKEDFLKLLSKALQPKQQHGSK